MRFAARVVVMAAVLTVVVLVGLRSSTQAAKWDPIDPKDLALAAPLVEKDADAEALLWDVRVADDRAGQDLQTVYSHHLRVKIFTDRGREAQSRVDIPVSGSARVRDVEGRSIKRDGSYVELKGEDIHERELVKARGLKVRSTSFVLPAVETGGIVEYRWREIHDDSISQNLRLAFSRDIPVHLVRYHIAPLDVASLGMTMKGMPFHVTPTPLVSEGRGFYTTSVSNVPAHKEEPDAPSGWEVRPWLLIYYDFRGTPSTPSGYWMDFSRNLASSENKATSPTGEIKRATASLGLDGKTLDQKLAALVQFCRAKIKRVDVDTATDADRRGFKGNKSPTAALAEGRGTAGDVDELFIAMARAAGLDARLAVAPARDDVTFDAAWMLRQLMRQAFVAVRDGDTWRFVDPSNQYAPEGELVWSQELQPALIPDEKVLISKPTPAAPPEWSLRSRTATLRLAEDGTIEGDVASEFTGHTGMGLKSTDDSLSPAERESSLKDLLAGRLPGIEMSAVAIENVTDPVKPYKNRYHLRVPGYAQKTGSRLFVQPAVFQKGIASRFPSEQRRYPIVFDHAWKEVDTIRIVLPAGYELEAPTAPAPITLGRIGGYTMTITATKEDGGTTVVLTRQFFFGGEQRLQFPVTGYPAIKRFFDDVTKADAHMMTIRKAAGGVRP